MKNSTIAIMVTLTGWASSSSAQDMVQELALIQRVSPPQYYPDPVIVQQGLPVKFYITTIQREHQNRISVEPFFVTTEPVVPGKIRASLFTPNQTGDFTILNLGHGFTGTLFVGEDAQEVAQKRVEKGFQEFSVLYGQEGIFPQTLFVRKDVPLKLYNIGLLEDHVVSFDPFLQATRTITSNDVTTVEFVPDQVGNFLIQDVTFNLTANLVVVTELRAGDANQDYSFDQFDLVEVQQSGKYLTGQPATWGEGDWDGAPGGHPGNPPPGNGFFDQLDIIAALSGGKYLTGPYGAVQPGGMRGDVQTSIIYNAGTGEVAVDAPAGIELTSINIDSAAGIFTGEAAQNLGGSFDNDANGNIFKATFGSSFGSLSFGNVAPTGLSQEFVLGDLSVIGSLAGGGDLGEVDLIYAPEPASALLLVIGAVVALIRFRRSIS